MRYLWHELDKISGLLRKNCPKILFLDFDGTLTPIAGSPNEAKLAAETKEILQKISQKPNFYLAIISGRQLKDIKRKIRLPNIIYGGNHGLEGEIFDKKFIHPSAKKAVQTIREIRIKLNKIKILYKGVFIEDKKFAVGFHYRKADKDKAEEITTLLQSLIKSEVENKLISVAAGKKEIDILPKADWSKGHFANLIIKEVLTRAKKRPVIIAIGDDKTDEDAFGDLKDDVTIVVGKKKKSKAKYYLKNPQEVFRFLKLLYREKPQNKYFIKVKEIKKIINDNDFNSKEFLRFWKGLVRDSSGRWLDCYKEGIKYFKYGKQARPNINDGLQIALIRSSINHEEAFLTGLNNGSFKDFKKWLIQLHRKQSYFGTKGQILLKKRISQGEHTQVVAKSVLPLVKKYNDPYVKKGVQIVRLPGITPAGCPIDKWRNGKLLHYYPDPKFFNQYLEIMKNKLEQFILRIDNKVKADKKTIGLIAGYYQYGINMHIFEYVNQSLFANQANTMLKILGLNPMEHGISDFAAMRLQPKNFVDFFFDEVNNSQA